MNENQKILIALQKLSLVLAATAGKDLEKRNINHSEFLILSHLNAKGKSKTQKLAEISMVTSGGITYHINNLIKKEFIQKDQDLEDKRIYWISITKKGVNYINQFMEGHNKYLDSLFNVFTEEEKDNFYQSIRTFGKKLEERGKEL